MLPTSKLLINKEFIPFLNAALYLNNIPFIQSLSICNVTEKDSGAVAVTIAADVPCLEAFTYSIAFIPAGADVKIPLEALKINRAFLSKLSETEKAIVNIEVLENEVLVASETINLSVHPLEHFSGFEVLPELLASYVTPNHPYVYHVKRRAVEVMEGQNMQPAFEGYQSNSAERVLQMMSAIYTAIQSEEIIYSALAPGYEQMGQRLRLLNTIQHERFGNCIDLSLLFAACLEACDLNPIIIIVRGHAFVGCWLNDDKFPEIINDDKAAITKRLSKGIREIAAIEATSVCKGNDIRFTDALNRGEAQLVEREHFLLSLDVRRARTARIRPLPLLLDTPGNQLDEVLMEETITANAESKFDLGTIYEEEEGTKKPKTKQKIWERKLLDLSLRNNLLHLRMSKNMLQLVDIDISQMEDTLADGKTFSIMPDPRAEVLKKYSLFAQPLHASSLLYQTANDELRYNRLLSYYHQTDLDVILSHMHKTAKQAIEENGSSTLYLGVGLLKWFDRKTPEQPRFAPVLLIPVELNRRSVNSKFTMKSREEDTMINITLLEFLRQEYELNLSALEQLPYDEKGVDVAKVMGILRRAVMQLKGWDVEEQLVLGNFSFSKLILWKDIVVHQEALVKSEMVRSLVEGKLTGSYMEDAGKDLDDIHPAEMILPIPADVSQTEAVLTAQKGQSFILHGPPGTGKSQTITNIIADALYRGKRVLFVAAKKAALDVVYKRMEQIGLSPFSLELHSNKSKKSDVLQQLSHSLETAKRRCDIDFRQEADRLQDAKKQISSYVTALHQIQPVGWSLYDSISALENYRDKNFTKTFIAAEILQQLDAARWKTWQDWLPQYIAIANEILSPTESPLINFNITSYSAKLQEDIDRDTKSLLRDLSAAEQTMQDVIDVFHFPVKANRYQEWEQCISIMKELQAFPEVTVGLCLFFSERDNTLLYQAWEKYFEVFQHQRAAILTDYNRNVLKAVLSAIEMEWRQAQQSWFLPRWLKKNKIKKQLAAYRNHPFENDEQVAELFQLHNNYEEAQTHLKEERFEVVLKALNSLYQKEETKLSEIRRQTDAIKNLSEKVEKLSPGTLRKWMDELDKRQAGSIGELVKTKNSLLSNFIEKSEQLKQSLRQYSALTGSQFSYSVDGVWTDQLRRQSEAIAAHLYQLKDWINYVQIRRRGVSLQLQWFVDCFENKICSVADLADYFPFTVHVSLAQNIIARHEPLSLFHAGLFESKIEHYKKIARDFLELTKNELNARLAAQLPNTTVEAMQSSEIGILQRAIRNKGRGMSIRRLFDQIPTLLPRIAPCMLMSPISVAQYFDVDANHFDLVIFDEASQLPTCEAVSALARAKQAVIVGDPKQMPPTSFFTTAKLDEENLEIEDLESILDDCLSLSIPSKHLLRHYRSKHESLIAFSNINYYDNKLLTFPSADDLSRKVQCHHVPGYYDKGKTRTNKFEADAIAQYVKAHYEDASRRKYSLGIVTFSQAQQSLVEEQLQQLFMEDSTLEQAANEVNEPLFVKNLENVQGDERDIILFSVGYAPDEEGKMSMNFGPLNRNGGWRRLNVAVTRARFEMHVFATLYADQIDLNRTSSEGVAGLKAFLLFAEKGQLALHHGSLQSAQLQQQLPSIMSQRLTEKGLKVKCNIGTSGFKVDIGIIHPDKPQEYILGVILDGKYYFDARTTNDREMVMPSVLKALGWQLYRIWTMDWVAHSDRIIEDILLRVATLKETPQPCAVPEKEAEKTVEALTLKALTTETTEIFSQSVISKQQPYKAHYLLPVSGGNSETIYEFQHRKKIKEQIQNIVEAEAPISKALLYKKVLQSWNTTRAGSRLDKHLEGILREMSLRQVVHHQPFYWNSEAAINQLGYYRSNDTEKRNMEDIAPEELKVAITETVEQNLSIDEEELLRYIARLFGFAKVGKQIEVMLRYAIDLAEKEGAVKRDGGRVKVG